MECPDAQPRTNDLDTDMEPAATNPPHPNASAQAVITLTGSLPPAAASMPVEPHRLDARSHLCRVPKRVARAVDAILRLEDGQRADAGCRVGEAIERHLTKGPA